MYKYLILTIFTISIIIYFCINDEDDWDLHYIKQKKMSYLDSLYYTLQTITTVGYGDITPKSSRSKYITIIMISLLFNLFKVK